MKIFLDTANIDSIKKFVDMGIVDGITTNPSLISREKGHPEDIMKEIVKIVKGPVNLEVVGTKTEEMIEEGMRLKKFRKCCCKSSNDDGWAKGSKKIR